MDFLPFKSLSEAPPPLLPFIALHRLYLVLRKLKYKCKMPLSNVQRNPLLCEYSSSLLTILRDAKPKDTYSLKGWLDEV